MLQSAIFADLHVTGFGAAPRPIRLPAALNQARAVRRLAAWARALFVADETRTLSAHLLRDIGLSDRDGI